MNAAGRAAPVAAQPATIADERVGVNGAVAAVLTRGIGSMPALYLVLVIVGGWMTLATWGPLHRVDPYPFAFLLFLDNVVQLVLCLVILVGQRVLGLAADRRAVQTYEHAEAIFAAVAQLQAHLDRHDRALARGVSLLQSSPHPWIHRHRVQPPPQALDQAVGVNGRIAAWLTRRLGSMWAFYAAAVTQLVWIGLAQVGVQRIDPYPFAFMSFLSTLAQLVFMIVIMVGQDVLGRAADRRSEQTFLDAEAILHECGRMQARLAAQDRIIDALADYTTTQVTEQLAHAIHAAYLQAALQSGEVPGSRPALNRWDELPQPLRESNRAQARQFGEHLAAIGCLMVPATQPTPSITFTDTEVELLARLEHQRWLTEHTNPPRGGDPQPNRVGWEQLPGQTRTHALDAARRIPVLLADVGFHILREGQETSAPAEPDLTPQQRATLQQALMAAGVLVALAEGVADAEEILALVRHIRETGISHPSPFIRDLAANTAFSTGLRASTTYHDYAGPALATIHAATTLVATHAPTELAHFQRLLVDLATTVADANAEGGLFGIGAHTRTPNEAAAIHAVHHATTRAAADRVDLGDAGGVRAVG
ncbi:MAG TPA: DUF1003 domain-containing protein [Rugosimonospora sp.]|nr:DUF1003 domain-containing protein [Rugosimonospora sp.]